eukprot:gene1588-32976_t
MSDLTTAGYPDAEEAATYSSSQVDQHRATGQQENNTIAHQHQIAQQRTSGKQYSSPSTYQHQVDQHRATGQQHNSPSTHQHQVAQQRQMARMAARRQQQMGAAEVVDLSGEDPAKPAGRIQQVAPHKGGPGAHGMRPLAEAVQHTGSPGAQGPPASAYMIRGLQLAHTSAVEQGLERPDTFAKCRGSFLTWMRGTPMAQVNKQGSDLEQANGIERRLLECIADANYCLDLLEILGFLWFADQRNYLLDCVRDAISKRENTSA